MMFVLRLVKSNSAIELNLPMGKDMVLKTCAVS